MALSVPANVDDGGTLPDDPKRLADAGQAILMATSRDWLAWADPDGTIRAVRKTGEQLTSVARQQGTLTGLAIDATGVYWGNDEGVIRMAPLE